MKTKEIRDLIDFISKSGLNEVNIETEEIKLSIKRDAEVNQMLQSAPMQAPTVVASAPTPQTTPLETPTEAPKTNLLEVRAPMIGTFYLTPNPDSEPFSKVGDVIEKGQTVCIIEAMKLFNEIESEVSGKIVKILVDNSSPVEYDQPLFLIDPS